MKKLLKSFYYRLTATRLYNRFFVKPYMNSEETEILSDYLMDISDREPLKVFEYGSGSSSIYFGKILKNKNIIYEWYSVDHVKFWVKRIQNILQKCKLTNVEVFHRPIKGAEEKNQMTQITAEH